MSVKADYVEPSCISVYHIMLCRAWHGCDARESAPRRAVGRPAAAVEWGMRSVVLVVVPSGGPGPSVKREEA